MSEAHGVVIVGAGQAGGRCALALRQQGYAGKITLLGDEPHLPYERPPLSKESITSPTSVGDACPPMMTVEQLTSLDIEHRRQVTVAQVQAATHSVRTNDGQEIAFQYLVLATGSSARPWTFPGVDRRAVHLLRNIEDAQRLKLELRPGRRVLVVGGGFIGLELAASARVLGCAVTIVEPQARLLARALSAEASEHIRHLHVARGATVYLGRRIGDVQVNSPAYRATLDDGTAAEFDLIVAGVGSVANTGLAAAAGLLVCPETAGVLVNADCITSDDDVYAVGDIATQFNALYGRRLRLESWDNAEVQAAAAARSIAARAAGQAEKPGETPQTHVPWFWTDQHGVNLQMLGLAAGADKTVSRGAPGTKGILFHFRGKQLIAAELFNSARDRRVIKQWIKDATPLDLEALGDAGQPLANAARINVTKQINSISLE